MKAHNDNELFPFTTLGAATLNVVRYLQGEQKPEQEQQRPGPEQKEGGPKPDSDYIKAGLQRIAEFERRASGQIKGRR